MLDSDIDIADALRHLSVPTSSLSRRRFLQALAAGAGAAAAASLLPAGEASAFTSLGTHEGVLLMIYLAGGNDGLNTLVPFNQSTYYTERPTIAIPEASTLPVGAGVGLHPNLTFLKTQFDSGQLAIVQGVGVADPDYSHFTMLARWMDGSKTGSSMSSSGWIGRWADGLDATNLFSTVNVGWGGIPLHLVGQRGSAISMSTSDAGFGSNTSSWQKDRYAALREMATKSATSGTWPDAFAKTMQTQLTVAATAAPSFVGLPSSNIRQFAVAANLINADIGIRVVNVVIDGFDNHSDEPTKHASLMTELNDGLQLFWSKLSPDFQNRTTAMTFSEFGRRVVGNDSKGTDHGAASCMFLMGPRVMGGLHGSYPSLTNLAVNDQLKPTVDFRQVYQQVVDKWLGGDSAQLLGGTYSGLNLFSSSPGDTGSSHAPIPTVVQKVTGSSFRSIVPERVLDTRSGLGAPAHPVGPETTLDLTIAGVGHVPLSDVVGVLMNVTVAAPTKSGFLTVWPTGAPLPQASNLNFAAQQTVPNLVLAKLGTGGKVSIFNSSGTSHLIADVCGYFIDQQGSRLVPLAPFRALDTRSQAPGVLHPKGVATLKLTDVGGIPASGVDAVALNVTAVSPTTAGFLTVWPSGEAMPITSNLNFMAKQTVPNMVVSKVGSDGAILVYNDSGNTHLIVDIVGYYASTSGTGIAAIAPARLLDTRGGHSVGPNSTRDLMVVGVGPVPAEGVVAVILNVTAVQPSAPGFLTVFPAGQERPVASSLNFSASQTVANLVLAKVGAAGSVSFYNSAGATDLVVDVVGYSVV